MALKQQMRQLVANDWPAKLCFFGAVSVAVWFLCSQVSPPLRELTNWRVALGFIALCIAVIMFALLFALVLSAIFVGPVYQWQARMNGGPFRVGDTVRVIAGPEKGRVAKIYQLSQAASFRIDLGEDARARLTDIYAGYQVERVDPAERPN